MMNEVLSTWVLKIISMVMFASVVFGLALQIDLLGTKLGRLYIVATLLLFVLSFVVFW